MNQRAISLIIASIFSSLSLVSQNLYFPPIGSHDWEIKSPGEMGWCQEHVGELLQFLEQSQTKAFILLHDGKIVIEHYFDSHNQNSLWYWASAGKTLVAFLTGMAQEKGFLSITDTTSRIIGQGWTACTTGQEQKITVWHQLTMTSGLDDGVADNHCTNPQCLIFKANAGTRWAYHNAPYTLLETVLARSTNLTLNQVVNNWLKVPTGITGQFVKQGYNNVFFSNARSMARFGLLILNGGNWDGFDLLADQGFFTQMVNSSQGLNKSYGYLWWLNGKESYMLPGLQIPISGALFPDAPPDTFVAAGKNGQFINVAPSQDLVWIRMGNSPDNLPVPFLLNNQIWQKINELSCSGNVEVSLGVASFARIFPNPASNGFFISADIPISKIQVIDKTGRLVFEEEIIDKDTNHHRLYSTNCLYPGVYFVLIHFMEGGIESKKFIKI